MRQVRTRPQQGGDVDAVLRLGPLQDGLKLGCEQVFAGGDPQHAIPGVVRLADTTGPRQAEERTLTSSSDRSSCLTRVRASERPLRSCCTQVRRDGVEG